MGKIIKFKDFEESQESGKFIINPYWLEHLLNLYYQDFIGSAWEEVIDTEINFKEMLENEAYDTIFHSLFDELNLKKKK